jgi:predicted regulator of Ras-like GTPase activity (Roadblock/LC7/MglB family)
MASLPQLVEEDVLKLEEELRGLLAQSEATTALLIDTGGFLIGSSGDAGQFDLTTIAALAAGAFMANQTIAGLVSEPHFNSLYQQGEQFSLFVLAVDEQALLVVIFQAHLGVGLVKYYAQPAAMRISRQLQIAHARNPDASLDLSELNLADPRGLFRKKAG